MAETRPSVQTAKGLIPAVPTYAVDENGDPVPGGGSGTDITPVVDAIEDTNTLLAAPVSVVPPTQLMFLGSSTPSGTVIPVDAVPVAIVSSAPVTIEAADADEVWGLFAAELYFSAACTFTIEGGTEDAVFVIAAAGWFSLLFRPLPYAQTTTAQAMTLTVSAGNCTGMVYCAKGVV